MLNIPTNIPNSATQILKLLWVVHGHTYANFMKILLLAYSSKGGTSDTQIRFSLTKKLDVGENENKCFDLTHLEMFNYYFIVFVWTGDMRTRQN